MTKSFEKIAVDSLHGLDYSGVGSEMESIVSSDSPVLDLSFKRSTPPPSSLDFLKMPSVSPLRESAYLEHLQQHEQNNNDNKHRSGYQLSESSQMKLAHRYQSEESTTFPSNHERKSPFESRSYAMTPPSESDSPKKPRLQSAYELSITGDSRRHPVYPTAMQSAMQTAMQTAMQSAMMPMSVPVPLPISMAPVQPPLPTPLPTPLPMPVPMPMPTASSPASHEVSQATVAADEAKKAPRPFKAYPKDPLSITLGPDMMFDQELKKAYSDFRNRMLDSVKRTSEGTNIKMRRVSKSPNLPTSTCDDKDAAYWERRRKNNEAAKRSRDARRAKEDEIAIRAAFLEQEYIRLKYENAVLKEENSKIKCMLYGH